MARVIMDHVYQSVLAPAWHQLRQHSPAQATLSTWLSVLDVRQFGTMPVRLSARSQGLMRIAPVIILVPEGFSRRFRTKSARESRMHTGTTFVVCGNRLRSLMKVEGRGSEDRTTHHSHSTPICSMDFRTFCAALTTRHRDSTSMATLLQSKRSFRASLRDCSVVDSSHWSSTLSGLATMRTKVICGANGRSMSCIWSPVTYLLPGMFSPYRNAANSLLGITDGSVEDVPPRDSAPEIRSSSLVSEGKTTECWC